MKKHQLCATQHKIKQMHAADRNMNCVQHNKTHVDKSARCRANPRPRTHTMTENGARLSEPRQELKLKTWVPGSKHHAPHKTMYADERARDSSTLEAACSHENPDMMGVSGLCHKTMNNTRPNWQNPDTIPPPGVPNKGHQEQDRNMTAQEPDYTKTDTQ